MTLEELKALVQQGESARLEFKRSTGRRSDAAKTVCGLLNGAGEFVLFGITDTGEIRGQDVSAASLEAVATELRNLEPRALLEPERTAIGRGKEVILIRVPGGRIGGPYTYKDRPYQREGPTTVPMPQPRYEQLLVERTHPAHRWEIRSAYGLTVEDLDHAEITRTIDEGIRRGRIEEPGTRRAEELTIEDLARPHASQPWNPAIAIDFYLRGIIETWGRGTIRMAELIKQAGLVPPEFQERGPALTVTFRPTRYVPPSRISQEITTFQRELLQVLSDAGPTALSAIRSDLKSDVPERTVQDNLQMLRRFGLVEMKGWARGARWMLTGDEE